jgi:hypothetical protein
MPLAKPALLLVLVPVLAAAQMGIPTKAEGTAAASVRLPPGPAWQVLSRFSGKVSYYKLVEEGGVTMWHATYHPDLKTVILYAKLPRAGLYSNLRWRWRVQKFPKNADETIDGRTDSAGAVYVYFETTFKQYIIKYVWSVKHEAGFSFRTADSSIFRKMQVVVREGPPPRTDSWIAESTDPVGDFRKYFGGDDVPPMVGIGLLSDGDGTRSEVEADYADFELAD